MKKRLFIFLFILVLAVSVIAVACNKPVEHTHSYGEWEVVTPATCTTAGSRVRTCSCGEKETQSIPATGHKFGEWTTVKEATETEEGLQERTCSVCGTKETRKIDKLPKPDEPAKVEKNDGVTKVVKAASADAGLKVTQYSKEIEITGNVADPFTIKLSFSFINDSMSASQTNRMFNPNGAYYKDASGKKTMLIAAGLSADNSKAVEKNELRDKNGKLIQSAYFEYTISNIQENPAKSTKITINWTGAKNGEVAYTIDWSGVLRRGAGSDQVTTVTAYNTTPKLPLGGYHFMTSEVSDLPESETAGWYKNQFGYVYVEESEPVQDPVTTIANVSVEKVYEVEQVENRITIKNANLTRSSAIYSTSGAAPSSAEAWDKNATYSTKVLDAGYIIPLQFTAVVTGQNYKPTVTVSDSANVLVSKDSNDLVTLYWRIDENSTKTLDVTIKWSREESAKTYSISLSGAQYAGYADGITTVLHGTNTAVGNQAAVTYGGPVTQYNNKVVCAGTINHYDADTSTNKATAGYYIALKFEYVISYTETGEDFKYTYYTENEKGRMGAYGEIAASATEAPDDIYIKVDGKDVLASAEKVTLTATNNETAKIKLSFIKSFNVTENDSPEISIMWEPAQKNSKTNKYEISIASSATYATYKDKALNSATLGKISSVNKTTGAYTYGALDIVGSHYDTTVKFTAATIPYSTDKVYKAYEKHTECDLKKGEFYLASEYHGTHKRDVEVRGEGNYVYVQLQFNTGYYTTNQQVTYKVNGVQKTATLDGNTLTFEVKLEKANQEVKVEINGLTVPLQYNLVFGKLAEKATSPAEPTLINGVLHPHEYNEDHVCTTCGYAHPEQGHVDSDEDGLCDICGYNMGD